jgi:hypothetical protein
MARFGGASLDPHPAQARQAQIPKRNQEEASADRATNSRIAPHVSAGEVAATMALPPHLSRGRIKL